MCELVSLSTHVPSSYKEEGHCGQCGEEIRGPCRTRSRKQFCLLHKASLATLRCQPPSLARTVWTSRCHVPDPEIALRPVQLSRTHHHHSHPGHHPVLPGLLQQLPAGLYVHPHHCPISAARTSNLCRKAFRDCSLYECLSGYLSSLTPVA